eukprot:SM000010S04278  [mRNA]  locus=s10:595262:597526:- [translate_table: standard]
MDTVLRLQYHLQLLGYSGPLAPLEALLYPGETHYQLLAWLFSSLLGEAADKHGWADEVDTPGLVTSARILGFSDFEEIESLQGSESFHKKADFLFSVANLVMASKYTDKGGWSVDDQTQKDIELIDLIGQEYGRVTTTKLDLFPPDVSQHSLPLMSSIGHPDLEKQIAELKKCEEILKEREDDLVELKLQGPELVSYDNTAANAEVEGQLQGFLSAVDCCNQAFPQASIVTLVQSTCAILSNSSATLQLPGALMHCERVSSLATTKLPQLHGIGPAAKHVHKSYKMLTQLLLGLDTLRVAQGKLPAPAEDKSCAGNMSLERLTVCSNSEIVNLDRDIRTLSASGHLKRLNR